MKSTTFTGKKATKKIVFPEWLKRFSTPITDEMMPNEIMKLVKEMDSSKSGRVAFLSQGRPVVMYRGENKIIKVELLDEYNKNCD